MRFLCPAVICSHLFDLMESVLSDYSSGASDGVFSPLKYGICHLFRCNELSVNQLVVTYLFGGGTSGPMLALFQLNMTLFSKQTCAQGNRLLISSDKKHCGWNEILFGRIARVLTIPGCGDNNLCVTFTRMTNQTSNCQKQILSRGIVPLCPEIKLEIALTQAVKMYHSSKEWRGSPS